jgi:hypothetical protein
MGRTMETAILLLYKTQATSGRPWVEFQKRTMATAILLLYQIQATSGRPDDG